MDVDAMLDRIDYGGATSVDTDVLAALQRAFLLSVPFENLDIHIGRKIVLGSGLQQAKIVDEGRGGFCYECNSVFNDLLNALGFESRMANAQMMMGGDPSPPYDHMVLVVRVNGDEYLVDVGNGGSVRSPMRIGASEVAETPEGVSYRLGEYQDERTLDSRSPGEDWIHRFVFSPEACKLSEFEPRCEFQQTSPDSHFLKGRVTTLATRDGRISMIDRTLKVQVGETVIEERQMIDDADYHRTLEDAFGIVLPASA